MRINYFILFFILISAYLVNAQNDFILNRGSYSPFETVQVNAKFNVSLARSLSVSDFKLLDENNSSIPLSLSLHKINTNEYYLYFDVPDVVSGNYKFGVFNVFYNENGLKKNSFFTNIIIYNRTDNIVSVKPAYVSSTVNGYDETPFTLIIKNSGDNDVTVNIAAADGFFNVKPSAFKLGKKGSKNIDVNTALFNKEGNSFSGNINVRYHFLEYARYYLLEYNIPFNVKRISESTVPVITDSNKNITNYTAEIIKDSFIIGDLYGNAISENEISIEIGNGESFTGDFSIVNKNNFDLNNLTLTVSERLKDFVVANPEFIEEIPAKGVYPISLEINKDNNLDKNYDGEIIVKSSASEFSIPLFIYLMKSAEVNTTKTSINKTAAEEPVEIKNNGKLLVWAVLFAVIVVILALIIYMYKKSKIQQSKFDDFVDRVKGRK